MKLNHKQKVKLGRKLQAPAEDRKFFGVFQSKAWFARSEKIQERIAKQRERNAERRYKNSLQTV